MANIREIKAICKKCGKPAPSDKFVLDAIYKMMVCPNCVNDIRKNSMEKIQPVSTRLQQTSSVASSVSGSKPSTTSTINPKTQQESGLSGLSSLASANPNASKKPGLNISSSSGSSSPGLSSISGISKISTSKTENPKNQSRGQINREQISKIEETKTKPVGWDSDDDYLEKLYKQKKQVQGDVAYERLSDTKIRYTCSKCKYKFVYDTEKKYPDSCPYCRSTIFRFGY